MTALTPRVSILPLPGLGEAERRVSASVGFVALVVLVVALLSGCGAAATFPEEGECPAPPPLPTSRATPGVVSTDSYIRRLQGFATNLEKLRSDLRAKYPEDTFYRRQEFRTDFATYASQTVCTAQSMLHLTPPDQRFVEYDSTLDAALAALIEHTRAGREAVRSRNVSDYRDWYKDADQRIQDVRVTAYSRSQ